MENVGFTNTNSEDDPLNKKRNFVDSDQNENREDIDQEEGLRLDSQGKRIKLGGREGEIDSPSTESRIEDAEIDESEAGYLGDTSDIDSPDSLNAESETDNTSDIDSPPADEVTSGPQHRQPQITQEQLPPPNQQQPQLNQQVKALQQPLPNQQQIPRRINPIKRLISEKAQDPTVHIIEDGTIGAKALWALVQTQGLLSKLAHKDIYRLASVSRGYLVHLEAKVSENHSIIISSDMQNHIPPNFTIRKVISRVSDILSVLPSIYFRNVRKLVFRGKMRLSPNFIPPMLEYLELSLFMPPPPPILYPATLTSLKLADNCNIDPQHFNFPQHIKILELGRFWNRPITTLHEGLVELITGEHFNSTIALFPSTLSKLVFRTKFNTHINLPLSLVEVVFGENFSINVVLPPAVKAVTFCGLFNRGINIPASVETLRFCGESFNSPLPQVFQI
eukprot:TRINITY_DN3211_c0_g1_i1.p1 TRINITY_DN3211_c0_g1~~TRINITY_DN3211_c0_g1_i1.p1  ORF type:complete len:449 (+),score=64.24 TRINITY_DN3211_c0_g1_i1:136-1482(+)